MFLFVPALVLRIVEVVRQKFKLRPDQEFITTGGFILAYLALGSSKYQLPHYIFVVFPLAALMVARLVADMAAGGATGMLPGLATGTVTGLATGTAPGLVTGRYPGLYKVMKPFQMVVSFLIMIAALLTLVIVFPAGALGIISWIAALGILLAVALNKKIKARFFWASVVSIMLANVFITHHFYYNLLKYQLGSVLGRYIKEHNVPADGLAVYMLEHPLNAMHYYANKLVQDDSTGIKPGKIVLTSPDGLASFKQQKTPYVLLKQGDYFKVSELTPDFLNPATRDKAVMKYYLLKLQ